MHVNFNNMGCKDVLFENFIFERQNRQEIPFKVNLANISRAIRSGEGIQSVEPLLILQAYPHPLSSSLQGALVYSVARNLVQERSQRTLELPHHG